MEKLSMDALYAASRNGNVSTLTTLIQTDPGILNRVSLSSFSETPLHLSALYGHLEFSRVLISEKSTLAKEVDLLGRTPLHLASAEGHTEIVKALLQANKNICMVVDQDERIPLHLAIMRGRIEIIKELVIARQESIRVNLNEDSVLHLCLRYNHLDALQLLVESANGDDLLLNTKDRDGNSILHLAVMLKQMKAIKYLLSVPEIKREANAMNTIGYTPLDVLEAGNACPRDFKCFEIQNMLKEAGVKRSTDLNSSVPLAPNGTGVEGAQRAQSRFRRWWGCVRRSLSKHWKQHENWKEESRGTIMVVATVIGTMAFQAGISPPGGVWQNTSDCQKDPNHMTYNICEAGKAILSYSHPYEYLRFLYFNTTSFFASLCVILLVVIGFPLRSKFFIWLLTSALFISAASMTFTYIRVMDLVTPYEIYETLNLSFSLILLGIWYGVLLIASVIHIIRLLYWIVKKLIRIIRFLYWMVKKLCTFIRKSTRGPAEDPANV